MQIIFNSVFGQPDTTPSEETETELTGHSTSWCDTRLNQAITKHQLMSPLYN